MGAYFAGVYMSAVGKYQEGKTQKRAHDYNAERAEEKAAYEEEQSRLRWKRLIGQQQALYAKAGVDISSGSPLLIMSQTAAEGELEALNIRYAGENEAQMQRWYGKRAMQAAKLAAWSTLLTGGGGFAASQYGGRSSGGGDTSTQDDTSSRYHYTQGVGYRRERGRTYR
jgi:hypothetical protein